MTDFLDKMRSEGLLVDYLVSDGELHRVPTQSKPNRKNGWYIVLVPGKLVLFGDWQSGLKAQIKTGEEISWIEKQELNQAIEQSVARRKENQYQAALQASYRYEMANEVTQHPYLQRKGVLPLKSIKQAGGELLVPLFDISRNPAPIESIQIIAENGQKRFEKGSRVSGLCYSDSICQYGKGKTIYICEGVSTALSIQGESPDDVVVAAMNAGNLFRVTELVLNKFPNADIVIAGDDDWKTEVKTGINPGKKAALDVAQRFNLRVSFPPFSEQEKEQGLTDWNDYLALHGQGE